MTPWQISIGNLTVKPTPVVEKRNVGRPKVYEERDGVKECSLCHEIKPVESFRYIASRARRKAACIPCEAIDAKRRRSERKAHA